MVNNRGHAPLMVVRSVSVSVCGCVRMHVFVHACVCVSVFLHREYLESVLSIMVAVAML